MKDPSPYSKYRSEPNNKPLSSNDYIGASYEEDGLSDISSALNEDVSFGLLGSSQNHRHGTSFRESYKFNLHNSSSYDSGGDDLIASITKGNSNAMSISSRRGNNLELERILRDDDEEGCSGEDDDDNGDVALVSSAKKKRYNNGRVLESDILQYILNEEDDDNSRDENDSFARYTNKRQAMVDTTHHQLNSSFDLSMYSGGQMQQQQPTTIPLSHSMEVDAILDSVKDDDDESDTEQDIMNGSYLRYHHQRMLSLNTTSDGDDDEDLNFGNASLIMMSDPNNSIAYENMSTQYKLSRRIPSQEDDPYKSEIYRYGNELQSTFEGEQSLKEYTSSFLHRHNAKAKDKGTVSEDVDQQELAAPLSEDQLNEQISNMCLQTAELYERRLLKPNNRNVISPLTVKRRMKPKVTLQSKSRRGNTNITTTTAAMAPQQQPQSQPRFGFSGGIVQVKSMANLSTHILKSNAQQSITTQRDFGKEIIQAGGEGGGLPTTMAVNSKFIAVGTQRGEVWIFDLFEQLKMTLSAEESTTGVGNKKKTHPVTSIDLPIHGDYLLVGYGSGAIVLWDVIRGVVLKGIYDLHSSPITCVRLTSFPMGGGNDNDVGAVSVDASGLVSKIVFSKGMLWSSYSAETECLLDGTAGQILAMDTLPPLDCTQYFEGAMEYHPSAYKIVLIALSSDRSSFAVSVVPKVSVLHKWGRPAANRVDPTTTEIMDDGVSDVTMSYAPTLVSSTINHKTSNAPEKLPFLPCLSWGWGLVSGGKNSLTPILARGWGCCIQFLCANFPPCESDIEPDDGTVHWPAFGLHDEFDASSPVVSLSWLGSRSLVYLTLSNEFTIIDTVIMTMQERLDFSGIKLV
jgi:hypothetical protein